MLILILDERAYRIVVKGLHHTIHMDYIKEELSAQGHTVRDAHNAIGHRSKSSISLFFINLEPAPNNKEAFKMKRLCKSVVTVEPPLKFNDIPQCYRCHGYGHRRRYKLQVRCVKCGKDHATSECQKREKMQLNATTVAAPTPLLIKDAPPTRKPRQCCPLKSPVWRSLRMYATSMEAVVPSEIKYKKVCIPKANFILSVRSFYFNNLKWDLK